LPPSADKDQFTKSLFRTSCARRFLGRTHFCTTDLRFCLIWRPGKSYLPCKPGNQDYERIIHFLIFSSKKVEIDNAKFLFLLELVVIINQSWYNQYYIFLIIAFWSPISTFFDEDVMNDFKNEFYKQNIEYYGIK